MKLKDLQKAEFWIATILYAFAIIVLISNTSNRHHDFDYYSFKEAKVSYSYFSNYFVPGIFRISIIYFTFLLLNFCIIPALIQRKNEILNYSLILIFIAFIGLVNGVCTTYTDAYLLVQYDTLQQAYNRIFFSSFSYSIWLIILISAYACAKAFIMYMVENKDKNTQSQNQMRLDVGVGLAFWFVGMLLWLTTRSPFEIIIVWTLVIFSTIGIIVYSIYYLLPYIYAQNKKFKSFFWQVFFISILLAVPMSFISMFFFYTRPEGVLVVFLFHLPTQLIISAPLAWYVYKRRLASNNELTSLRTELGKSDASLSFFNLKSIRTFCLMH